MSPVRYLRRGANRGSGPRHLHSLSASEPPQELACPVVLRIGQNLTPAKPKDPAAAWQGGASAYAVLPTDLSPQEQAQLARSVSDLNLSVRARKCMARLGITTLAELVQRTPDELLATKNFGVTSLNEIRQQLGEIGLKLRND